ncbi:MAG: glyoxalase [Saprospiraceae bacterium]|nr:glyoxalase [Saprospiraceae bacterium]
MTITTERNSELIRLRPSIQTNVDENPENSAGHFQNATLRPILKLQNELLLQMFKHYLQKSKGSFFQLAPPKQLEFIGNSVRSDLRFRNLLTGVIIGHFTESEWEVFATQESEITRRIADMLIQRFSDQIDQLLA